MIFRFLQWAFGTHPTKWLFYLDTRQKCLDFRTPQLTVDIFILKEFQLNFNLFNFKQKNFKVTFYLLVLNRLPFRITKLSLFKHVSRILVVLRVRFSFERYNALKTVTKYTTSNKLWNQLLHRDVGIPISWYFFRDENFLLVGKDIDKHQLDALKKITSVLDQKSIISNLKCVNYLHLPQ